MIIRWFGGAVAALTSNKPCQKLLEGLVEAELWLMGIGAASSTESSGERVLVGLLRDKNRRIRAPLCIFDVGANRGQFASMLLSGLADVPLHVHAFEPSAATFSALASRYRSDARLTLNNSGLSARAGSTVLYSNAEESGIASLYHRRLDHFGIDFDRQETVALDTVDGYSSRQNIERIDLLKLDVEGHELDVLRGSEEMFRACKIDCVMFEFGGCNIDSRSFLQDFFYFFKEHGSFDLFRIAPPGRLVSVDTYREIYEQFRTTNFVAIRREHARA